MLSLHIPVFVEKRKFVRGRWFQTTVSSETICPAVETKSQLWLSNPGVTNFQGHSFKILLTHPLPSIIYFPLHVIRLSCLGSERAYGLQVLSHAPKNIAPLLTTP